MISPEYAECWWLGYMIGCDWTNDLTQIGYLVGLVTDNYARHIEGVVRELRKEFDCDVDWGFTDNVVCLYSRSSQAQSMEACIRAFPTFIPSPIIIQLTKI